MWGYKTIINAKIDKGWCTKNKNKLERWETVGGDIRKRFIQNKLQLALLWKIYQSVIFIWSIYLYICSIYLLARDAQVCGLDRSNATTRFNWKKKINKSPHFLKISQIVPWDQKSTMKSIWENITSAWPLEYCKASQAQCAMKMTRISKSHSENEHPVLNKRKADTRQFYTLGSWSLYWSPIWHSLKSS